MVWLGSITTLLQVIHSQKSCIAADCYMQIKAAALVSPCNSWLLIDITTIILAKDYTSYKVALKELDRTTLSSKIRHCYRWRGLMLSPSHYLPEEVKCALNLQTNLWRVWNIKTGSVKADQTSSKQRLEVWNVDKCIYETSIYFI